jgi:carbamoyltransferase
MSHYVLGIHDGHNASACLLRDGAIQFAVQEERLVGQKNYSGFPRRAVQACLEHAGLGAGDLGRVAFASMRSTPTRQRAGDQLAAVHREATLAGAARRLLLWLPYYTLNADLGWAERQESARALGLPLDRASRYDHHECHAATAYFGLRQDHEQAYAVLTVDGFGDTLSSTVSIGRRGTLTRVASSPLTDSLGSIYALTTGAMGFKPLEHEYKLMGLAPYASPRYVEPLLERFRALLEVDGLRFRRRTPEPTLAMARRLRELIAGQRFDVVCAALQAFTEERLEQLARAVLRRADVPRLLCAGGVFMNVKANKRLMEMPELEELGVFPSCGDESLAIGAAWLAEAESRPEATHAIPSLGGYYLGPDLDDDDCQRELAGSGYSYQAPHDLEAAVARVLAEEGRPLARCAGRMEFGARALGNRSILADPKNPDVVRVINRMIKKRDFWMPFAPVVRRERFDDYFVNPKGLSSPYMMLTFDSRENVTDLIAAVHAADLTARPQVVEETHNPGYYGILSEFERLTGRGVLLNTSFNLHGFPIVRGAKEALGVFRDSGLEAMQVGRYLVRKT